MVIDPWLGGARCPTRIAGAESSAWETDVTTVAIIEDHGIARAGAEQLIMRGKDLRVVVSVATLDELDELGEHPDVVVFDLAACHPNDSTSVIGVLAKHGAVLAISGYADGRDLVPAFHAGALGVVTRDTGPADFIAAVEAVARGSLYVGAKVAQSVVAELRQRGSGGRSELARREVETLRLLADGYTHSQIARRMGLAEGTVNTYVKRIRSKLKAGNKAELTRLAIDLGYVILAPPDNGTPTAAAGRA